MKKAHVECLMRSLIYLTAAEDARARGKAGQAQQLDCRGREELTAVLAEEHAQTPARVRMTVEASIAAVLRASDPMAHHAGAPR